MELLLQAIEVDVARRLRWRWLLCDTERGVPLADHRVDLDPGSAELAMFGDMYGYLRAYAPARRAVDESRIVTEAGAWAGRELLGRVGAAIVTAARSMPVTVRVTVPAQLDQVLVWPLELAHVDGRPLAARGDVTLVYDIGREGDSRSKDQISGALRMLAVFSLPTDTSVLALRRERYALTRLIRRIAARHRAAVELRVVQYGVTRSQLGEIAESGEGWDVLHLSGHGEPGMVYLEHPDGSPDPVDTEGLLELLRPARRRVKLAVLSLCESAADVTGETLRLVGLADQADALEQGPGGRPATVVTGLARALVRELDCAVVAMRYPVLDEFAIAFGNVLYEHVLQRGQRVDVAVARAAAEAARPGPSAVRSALSMVTPGVFGARAAGLVLKAPRGTPVLDPAEQKMAFFPGEPERFVGRAAAMAAGSAALAPSSGRTAALLYGMAGAGKTACALELAYRHQDGFAAAVFWQAPARDDEWADALPGLARALEMQLGDYGFSMTEHIATSRALEAFLPRLRKMLGGSGVLLVLDNLETLLTPDGNWRDPRWGPLISALTGHDGESRVILTSRIPPAGLDPEVLMLPVHALPLREAAALARELPNLCGLLHADEGPVRAQADDNVGADRERVRRVLHVVQGHPKLLELADAAATDRGRLDAQLRVAEEAADGQQLAAFFREGTSTLDPDQFMAAFTAWTSAALSVMPPPARLMGQFLAFLEDNDRVSFVIEPTWPGLWRRAGNHGDAPDQGQLLGKLATAALIQLTAIPAAAGGAAHPLGTTQQAEAICWIHPGVAAVIRASASSEICDAANAELADFWHQMAYQAREQDDQEEGWVIVHAALAAAPYLLRRHDWARASALLDNAIRRDRSPATVQAALPALRRIADATHAPGDNDVLGSALTTVDPVMAERLLDAALGDAVQTRDHWLAGKITAHLADLLLGTGRLREALEANAAMADFMRRAELGPWTQLACQAQRLEILERMGEHRQVLDEALKLRAQMGTPPARSVVSDPADPWNVREMILNAGRGAAVRLGKWQLCLDLGAELLTSARERGAGEHYITSMRWFAAEPLIHLGRLAEAGRLLNECQQVFDDNHDHVMLVTVLGARAQLETVCGNRQAAAELGRTALRLSYARCPAQDIASCHLDLAVCLRLADGDQRVWRAHLLAAALLFQLTGDEEGLARAQHGLVLDVRESASSAGLPATAEQVIQVIGHADGARLGELIATLEPNAQVTEDVVAQILRNVSTKT